MGAALGPLLGMANQQPQQMQQQQAQQPAKKENPFNFAGQSAPTPQQFSQGVQQSAPSDKKGPSLMDILSMMGNK